LALVTACGGDDGAGAAAQPTSAVTTAPSDGSTSPTTGGDAPDATVSPELPEILVGEVRPLQVIGAPLPPHTLLPDDPITTDEAVGLQAPVLVGEGFDGETIRVDAAAAGPTMVVFLAHWCSHCNAEVPRLNQLRDEGRFPASLNIIGVSTAVDPGRPNFPPSEWVVAKDWTYPTIADDIDFENKVLVGAEAFGLSGFPFITLIDGDGAVVARWSGEREPDEVIDLINTYLPGI
jgi:thiol-disulfide isomerase/thioredoxin